MSSIIPQSIARQPWSMLVPLVLLALFGAAVLYSAAGGSMSPFATPHLIRFGLFLLMALTLSLATADLVKLLVFPLYSIVLAMLVAVEVIGALGGGSQRWLELGFMRIQPSELMKPVVVITLARFYESLPIGLMPTWRALVPAILLVAAPVILVLMQPDLGTAIAIAFGGIIVMLLAGLPMHWFKTAAISGAIALPLFYAFALKPYQQQRVLTFLNPESDPLGSGYHITQSKIAIGSGGIAGKGFNEGSQSHLHYLPEPHTDFVFATMAEEWGLIGGLLVLSAFAMILHWGMKVARTAQDRFSQLMAAGMTVTIFFYVAVNLMMVMGLAPVVGIPLPWMSHGGSSMMTNMICIAGLMMVHKWNRNAPQSRYWG